MPYLNELNLLQVYNNGLNLIHVMSLGYI